MACMSICNFKINRDLLPVFCITLFCFTNTMFSFSLLYLLTEERVFSFDHFIINLFKYLLIGKVFNGILAYYFFPQILQFLAKYYEVGYFNPFITETNQLVVSDEEKINQNQENLYPLDIEFPVYVKKKNDNIWELGQDDDLKSPIKLRRKFDPKVKDFNIREQNTVGSKKSSKSSKGSKKSFGLKM